VIGLEDRQTLAQDIETADAAGARLHIACKTAGISVRSLQRWKARQGLVLRDGRHAAVHPISVHARTTSECEQILRDLDDASGAVGSRRRQATPARIS
jgi:hypothetical protein